ncbi:MAG: hypothetical protein DHS20C21_16300 [Gemmatimonadota bacterium]|nr:MAG: hypothetical protein DHS20C21_16300 [Gemmatimonadota bacterium]
MTVAALPRVGVSACLLGERVRWDGDHRLQPFAAGEAARVEWVPVCPEVGIGLGVPREPIQLVRLEGGMRLFGVVSKRDLTETMRHWADAKVRSLTDLDGFVLKHRSPSCGVSGARVAASLDDLREDGPYTRSGQGLFAETLRNLRPELAIAEETDLEGPDGRREFFDRVQAAFRRRTGSETP